MAAPIQGPTKPGAVYKSAPVLVAGVDSDGKVRPILVDATGQISPAA